MYAAPLPLLRVLHLPKWYPHRYDDQDGDFVARHVAAIAATDTPPQPLQSAVVFAAVARGPLGSLIESDIDLSGPVSTWRYYYRARLTGLAPLDKLLKLGLWLVCMGKGWRAVRRHWQGQRPDIVHAHVLLRTGLWALWLRWRHRIPYVITEHWTLYLPERAQVVGPLRWWLSGLVVGRAAALHTVSASLRNAMAALGIVNRQSVVIANVVDTTLFRPLDTPRTPHRLLVVSAFNDAIKNISGILKVVAQIHASGQPVELRLAGYGPDEELLRQYSKELGLLTNNIVTFLGKLSHVAVAQEMQAATALVSFSRAETFGCVFLEARSTGCPVVAPAICGVLEHFKPKEAFGILVTPDNEIALKNALTNMLLHKNVYNDKYMHCDVSNRCGSDIIGKQFYLLYTKNL